MIKQLSVFLENKAGRINEVCKVLAAHDISMQAFSMAESADFGILRLIVDKKQEAVEVLRQHDFAVMLTDVVGITCPHVAGSLSRVLECLASHEVFIEYMYAFASGDMANNIIRTNDNERCEQILRDNNYCVLSSNDL